MALQNAVTWTSRRARGRQYQFTVKTLLRLLPRTIRPILSKLSVLNSEKPILSVFEIFRSYKMSSVLKFHKLSENAMTPIRGSEFSAGLDLFAAEAKVIATKGRALIKTDLQVALPDGCYGRIAPRSGLAYKKVKFPLMKILEQK